MVEELCCGSCLAMEIRSQGDVPIAFRDFVGPPDPVSNFILYLSLAL